MFKNGQIGLKWSKMVKMVKKDGADLKQALRTGLSARKAGMTKSRGPKGLQLEVGPRRGPETFNPHIKVMFIGIIKVGLD